VSRTEVSIITPMYNAARFVAETIESVIAQTFTEWEMIIVDDCSTDNGAGIHIVKEYQKKESRIKLIALEKNRGSSGARNAGIDKAIGRYICLLDADDLWKPEFLEFQLQLIQNKNAGLVFSAYEMIDENGNNIKNPFYGKREVTYRELLQTNVIGCLTAMYDTEVVGKVYLDESLKSVRDDYELWLRILKMIEKAYGNSEILAQYRILSNSATGKKLKMIIPQWNIYRKVEKLNLFYSIFLLFNWAINGIIKHRN
jgi:teichuronic acid biosynthesis glycosyltransferase TuaG